MHRNSLYTLLVLSLSTSSCAVWQSTYDELDQRYQLSQKELADRTARVTDLETEVARLEGEVQQLETAKSKLENDLANILSDKTQLESSVAEMQTALAELEKRKAEAEARVAEYREFVNKFKKLIDEGKLRVQIRDGRMILQLATDILFESGKAELSETGLIAIQQVGAVLATIPNRKYQVEGHTDNLPIKTSRFPSNWELAAARAINVVNALVTSGMPATSVSAASFADTAPVASNDTDTGRAQNRRIDIVVVPDLSLLPGFSELQNIGS
ncbi:MAG: OmpA family protein [Myxococcota bacterium]|jgi:chemotaxis protein MotB|nr:OmpA family protein [Myxococcota bacterium]